jgi:hypothetical protein
MTGYRAADNEDGYVILPPADTPDPRPDWSTMTDDERMARAHPDPRPVSPPDGIPMCPICGKSMDEHDEWTHRPVSPPLTAEAERQLRRDVERGGPFTPGDVLALFATLAVARAAPQADDPIECGICGDYSAQGVEVHESCLEMLSRLAAPQADEGLRDRLRKLADSLGEADPAVQLSVVADWLAAAPVPAERCDFDCDFCNPEE